MDPSSWLVTCIWLLLVLAAGAAAAVQTVASAAADLRAPLSAAQSERVRRLNAGAGVAAGGALAGAAAVAVAASLVPGDGVRSAVAAGLSAAVTLAVQSLARGFARGRLEWLARPILGEAAVFLPLIEPRPESLEPDQAREETLEQMVDAGEKAGLIESDEHEMIRGIIGLERTLAREIMVPRIDVIAVDVETPLRQALDVVVEGAHSRVPVYEESIDHVVGLLYAKDILKALRDGKGEVSLRSLLRPAYFVPETKRVDELLQELQRTKVHMTIVVDEYGGTAGIVTIEDVLEEIVGEIQDEYDTGEEPLVELVSENEGIFNARVNIEEVKQALSVELPEDSDTLGGLVYQRLGKMPKVGDQVVVNGVTISVLSVAGRRIKKVRVKKNPIEEQASQNAFSEKQTT